MQTSRTYRSAVSYGLFIPAGLLLAVAAVTAIYGRQVISSILVTGVILGIVLPIFLNTSYTINGGILQVRSGWIVRVDIPVASIKAIRPTNSILSSPALSVADRIEITYGKFDSVIVSPKERAEFIADLVRLNPAIVVMV
ncbi:PH domain-containing protein [Mucilaginibacter sp. CAU 1740]|uniref:PH domain-containing protein n=1 Tax=Mucilaginibacter sp. CAU 1740 TaxID=3140365 RepID=UPI00325AEE7B